MKTKEMLEKQMELLFERSKEEKDAGDLVELTGSMIRLYDCLMQAEKATRPLIPPVP